jgi:hypothetical protein
VESFEKNEAVVEILVGLCSLQHSKREKNCIFYKFSEAASENLRG